MDMEYYYNNNTNGNTEERTQQYESCLYKFKDERDAIQKKTFTKWVNKHLKKANKHVDDLFEDLRDGHNLISLLEVLSGDLMPRERGRMRFHMLHNVQIALDFLRVKQIKLVNIRAEDIVDGNPKLTLGLIWTIILFFQISDIITGQTDERLTAREALLRWAQRTTDRYPGVKVTDFTASWRDGLAFNAILHRNRPELIDFRSLRTRHARENLETAFNLAEREFGVTKLLDPEDVDTPEPDEKSLITYISSLYDVFPSPPAEHPFTDDDKRHKVDDYRDFASSLHHWMRESTSILQDRNFPNNLVETKALLAECTRFRVEEIPPRLHDKQRLSHMWKEIRKKYRESSLNLESELHYENIERRWNKLMNVHAERDQALHDEISRLEKLQRLAEKVHREAKQCDTKLDDIERKIIEEEKRIQRLHPMDAKQNCDQIESDLKHAEESIKSMTKDVGVLKEGRYHQAIELQRRVQHLHERWVSLRMALASRLLTPLSSRSFRTEEKKVTKQRTVISEQRLIETNEAFRFLQECIEWVGSKLKFLDSAEYGSDLPSVQQLLDQHTTEHRHIDQFQKNIDQCEARKNQFKGEEFDLYCKLLNKLNKTYSELLVLSNKRLSDLETLLDFIQSATNELIWMNEKEEIEVSRDWTAKNLNLVDIEQYQETFTCELEKRELQFGSVQDRGETLVVQRHPAVKCIEAYLAAMQTQWSWLLQLTLCLQTHLRYASAYHQFFTEGHECEQWLRRIEDRLNTTYSRQSFNIDDGERLLKEMQEVRDDLTRYGSLVAQLMDKSKDVVPLKQRRQPLPRPLRVSAICAYKQLNMSIVKDEQCWLHDNSQKTKWKVINSNGTEGMVPAVCFLIPPPNQEAIELAESLRKHFDGVVQLWVKKQHRLRLNMIFATIKIVKCWDLAQFRAMGAHQREAIMKALNEDADKLLSEGDRSDPALKRLEEEIAYCNKLFQDLLNKLREEDEERSPKSATRRFGDLVSSLQPLLSEKERTLNSRVQAPVPRDLGTLEVLVIEHREFEAELRSLEPQMEEAKMYFKAITRKTPALQTRHDNLVDTWDRIWELSHLYIERLKAVEIAIHGLEEATRVLNSAELHLAAYDDLPSDIDALRKVQDGLFNLREEMDRQQPVIDQMGDDAVNVRHMTERSRPKQTNHVDVNKLDEDIRRIVKRWENARAQIIERLHNCETAAELLNAYKIKQPEESSWMNKMEVKVKSFKTVKTMPPKEAEVDLEVTKMAMEAKYKLCVEGLSRLVSWLAEVEQRLAGIGAVKEDLAQLQHQVLEVKAVRENLEENQHPVLSTLDQVRQVVTQGQDVLSRDEIQQLQKESEEVKKRYDSTTAQADRLHHLLDGALEELHKFTTEQQNFVHWINAAQDTLLEKERELGDLSGRQTSTETIKAFVSDVIAHQADLRFITMAAQKFLDESKDYLRALNDYRTNLPRRLSHVESSEGTVKVKVAEATSAYQTLSARVNRLNDKLSSIGDRQRHYTECVEKANSWLSETRKTARRLLEEPVGTDLRTVQDQLDRLKALSMDVLGQARLIDNVRQAARSLLESLEGTDVSRTEIQAIEETVRRLDSEYTRLTADLQERGNELQTALLQCQDVQDNLDRLLRWLDEQEATARTSLSKPASLIRDKLDEQFQDYRIFQAELDSQKPSVEALNASARELLSSSNQRLARKVESKLKDLNVRYEKLQEKAQKRKELLEEVSTQLNIFETLVGRFESWFSSMTELVESRELTQTDAEVFASRMEDIMNQRNAKKDDFEELLRTGKALVNKRDVTDTSAAKEKLRQLEQLWKDLGELLSEKQGLAKVRADQLNAYNTLRAKVLEWLATTEAKVDRLDAASVDRDILRRQALEVKALIKDHSDFAPTIDKVNDLGNQYDAMLRGESPRRKVSSPVKKTSTTLPASSPTRKSSPKSSDSLSKTQSPLSSISSGFSSRRSSADNFGTLEDLSPVQQQLSEINNRYHMIGVRLTDRHQELETLSEDVRRYLESLKVLSAFVQAKERQLPKDALPVTREQADKHLQILKEIHSEVLEKQPEMDRLKTQTSELHRLRPNAEGMRELKAQVSETANNWSELQISLRERMNFLQDLKDFQDTHEILNNWLNQKDKMFQVLGPIASEPRMVNAQMQQVQVMRDEFASQQTLLNRLDTSGLAVLDKVDGAAAKKIKEQMTGIRRRWEEQLARLSERERNLDAASGATKDFHDTLRRLQDSLQHINDEFDMLSEGAADAQEQLRKLNDLEDQLEEQRPHLAAAESVCENLCEILSDSASKSEIKNKLNSLEKLYSNLTRKMNNRKAELESSLREDREFLSCCADIQSWMDNTEGKVSKELHISADEDRLCRQLNEFEPIYRDVLDKEHEVHLMLSKGGDIVSKTTRKTEAAQLKGRMDTMKRQWDKIRKGATDKHTRLQGCLESCRRFHSAANAFGAWLEQSEDKLNDLRPVSFKRPELDKQVKEMQVFKSDVSRHSQEMDSLRHLGENLLTSCDADKEAVKSHLDQLKRLWDRLNQGVTERVISLEGVSQSLWQFQEQAREAASALLRLEDKLSALDMLGDTSRDPKLLSRMKALLTETEALSQQLDRLRGLSEKLIAEAGPGSDTEHIADEVNGLFRRHQNLMKKIEERCGDLESATEVVAQFNGKMRTVHHDLNSLEEELEGMGPIARDKRVLTSQISEIQDFGGRLVHAREEMEEAEAQCRQIISQGFTPDPKGCQHQLDNLQRQLNRLDERARVRENSLEEMMSRVEHFFEDLEEINRNLKNAISEEQSFRPIGGEVELIRLQQEELFHFHTERVEPLGKKIAEANKTGQGLVQSASSGVDTSSLDQELDKLNDKWNSLKERLNERERRLDGALLQSGKFQEALEGVHKWLLDTEEMVANQKPPSADYKVVKAQLQEQKFLNKLLLDRQTSMTSLMTMGKEVMKNLDGSERAHIDRQLRDLNHRFDVLTRGAQERMNALERTLPVAHDFQDRLSPLQDWLEQIEKRLAAMATIPTQQDRIRKRINEHTALHEDILDHKRAFEELTETAQTLMGLVGDDEAAQVIEKLQEVTDQYARVVDQSEHIGQLLSAAREGLSSFSLNFEDILAWIQEMELRVARFSSLSVFLDKLQEQVDELTEVTEEIGDHQKQVSDLFLTGQEIMKHASGDDAVQIKDKLDTLQVRFKELTERASSRLVRAQEALPLVHTFHESHDRLNTWLDEAERSLRALESSALNTQEATIQKLESEISANRSLLEAVNHLGPQLCHISPGEGAAIIESSVTRANRRFDAVCEQVQRKAERIELSKQRNVEVIGDIDDLLDWFRNAERELLEAEPIIPDPDVLAVLLKEQKRFNEEVSGQKGRVRDILANAKKLMRESSSEDLAVIRDKAEDLKETMTTVAAMCADRLSALEQALPLAEHFYEAHNELAQWMDDVEAETDMLEAPILNLNQIKKHQDKTKSLLQSVSDHKPLLDKLTKTGAALIKLCGPEDGRKVQDLVDADSARYNMLRQILRDRQSALEEALQATSQFADKLDGMLNALSSTADQLNNAEPISAHPERIHEQINDNKAVLQDLDKRSSALAAVKQAANDVIHKAGTADEPAVKDIKKKLGKLNDLWESIQKTARNRGRSLEEALAAAEKFWEELTAVMKALKELQDNLNAQEPPAVEPNAIQQQKENLHEIKQEMDQTKPEVDHCRQAGQDLMQLCGEPDKPEVKKHIEDLDSAWDNVTTLFAKREQNLIKAMEKAMNFHDTLQNLLEFLDSAEEKMANIGPLGSDIESVKGQIGQLKDFKKEVDPHMVEVEALNRQAQELMERTSPDQGQAIRVPLAEINRRWDDLLKAIVERQRDLENALLRLGQFQHALDELLVWISKTEKTLDDLRPVFGDPQVIEVELAKHKVLMNDIQAHQTSVDTLNRAGRQLIESDRGSEDANVTQKKLSNVNSKWQELQDKAAQRHQELEEALKEAQAFNQEIQDLLVWLSDIDSQLVSSKPVGGLPETARDQLNRFMELFNELDSNRHKVDSILQQGQEHLKRSGEASSPNLQHNLKQLKQRWDNVLNRANDRKIKLEIALREATEFHQALQEFVEWLTNSEKYLSTLKPVSRVMDSVLQQIEEHKAFQKDVGAHREVMLNLDKKGTHLKYFSQKQDVILIKNLLISVQHRWERAVSKAAERTRALDHGYKESKEFHDAYGDLSHWLEEAEQTLNGMTHIGNDPEKIKQLLAKHKEFQRTLGAKQPIFDASMKLGRTLKDKCPKVDVPVLQDMLDDLKNKWNSVCAKSVDRQRKLEEALLFSGQFKDAVQALIDWLDKSRALLSQDQPVHGDLDTVMALVDQHKNFQEEVRNRASNLDSVRRTASELLQTASTDDAQHIRSQLQQLESKWEEVVRLSDRKQSRLDEALKQAEQLHKAVHMLLEWLSDAEMKLRFAGPLPEDEETTKQQMDEHKKFMREMADQESNKDQTIQLAQLILQKCHPDAVSVIRHWITIIQSRWEEVALWAKQREQRLSDHLRSLRDIMALLEELMAWLLLAESNLTALEAEPLPDDLPTLEGLIKDHQVFMDDMTKKQPDVEQVTKAFQSKKQPPSAPAPSTKGAKDKDKSKTPGATPTTPKSSTPVKSSPSGEPEIRHPRARALLDKWRHVWLLAMERQRRLQDKYNYLLELDRIKNFNFDEWRQRFLGWMNNKKSRIMDLFRKIDKDNDGKVTQEEFIEGILKSKFPTSRLEMERVADIFDRNGDGYVDHKEYLDTLRPDRDARPLTEEEKIQDEVQRQVAQCTCAHRFKVYQVGEGKYRFGESQKLRLVRILRSTVMVRVGGGWVALDEFLVKNDPCRAKGRTNLELREQFILAEGVSQSMTPFKAKHGTGSTSSQSSQGTFGRSAGPITKVREKSERSVPMRRASGGQDTSSDLSGPSFSDATDSAKSTPRSKTTSHRLAPPSGTGKPSSRPSSRPGSRPPSRPASRAGSDLSAESVEAYRGRRTSSISTGTPGGTTTRTRTPSGGPTANGTTKTPGVRRSSSNASSKDIPIRQQWK